MNSLITPGIDNLWITRVQVKTAGHKQAVIETLICWRHAIAAPQVPFAYVGGEYSRFTRLCGDPQPCCHSAAVLPLRVEVQYCFFMQTPDIVFSE